MNRLMPRCSHFVLSSAFLVLLCSSPTEAQEPVRVSSLEEDIRAIEELSGLDNEASSLSLDDALKSALSENLGLRVAVRNLSAARSRLKASWAPFMPFATGSWGYQPSKTERWFDQYETW